jgi:hypothetical protein
MLIKVEDLKRGDRVDPLSCPYSFEEPFAEFEYMIVDEVERETDTCTVVKYLDFDMVGYPVGTELEVAYNEEVKDD